MNKKSKKENVSKDASRFYWKRIYNSKLGKFAYKLINKKER